VGVLLCCCAMLLCCAPVQVDDANFKKLVAIIRIAVPYTGMILSTRESAEMRDELLKVRKGWGSRGGTVWMAWCHCGTLHAHCASSLPCLSTSPQSSRPLLLPPAMPACVYALVVSACEHRWA
jgi:hypothetical protein